MAADAPAAGRNTRLAVITDPMTNPIDALRLVFIAFPLCVEPVGLAIWGTTASPHYERS